MTSTGSQSGSAPWTRVLVVDDDDRLRRTVRRYLESEKFLVTEASDLATARQAVRHDSPDAILLDLRLPDGSGLDWIEEARAECPGAPVIMITGHGDVPQAVRAMQSGAAHFLVKPVELSDLVVTLDKSLEIERLKRGNEAYHRSVDDEFFWGESYVMRETRRLANSVASEGVPMLLLGETGTGKGRLARWLHRHGTRADAPLVEVNCSLLSGDLLASELFGHARGAFTSADSATRGLVDLAHEGTLFLDEIGDLDISLQARILKLIEEKTYRRLGDPVERKSDFQLICATNHDLDRDVVDGRFRRDLLYRINTVPILLPALRERAEDLPGLVDFILGQLARSSPGCDSEALRILQAYSWPGNVRELRNVLERAHILARGQRIGVEHLPSLAGPPAPLSLGRTDGRSLRAGSDRIPTEAGRTTILPTRETGEERLQRIQRALAESGGNRSQAARLLGISRATLYRWLREAAGD